MEEGRIREIENRLALMQIAEGRLRRSMRRRIAWLTAAVIAEGLACLINSLLLLRR